MKYLLITLVAVIAVCCACKAQKKYGKVVAVKEYAAAISADTTGVLIDVRTPEEYATAGRTYYIYCRSGRRSQTAAAIMEHHGLQVVDLEGGYKAWTAAGMEVRKD